MYICDSWYVVCLSRLSAGLDGIRLVLLHAYVEMRGQKNKTLEGTMYMTEQENTTTYFDHYVVI
jgi:hypothetical protein